MQVYNAYFKIVKKNLPIMLIYFCAFLLITIPLTCFYGNKSLSTYTPTRINIALVNDDGENVVTEGLRNYLNENANIIDINRNNLQDALFFRKVEYILRMPPGFSQSCLTGKNVVQLEKTSIPDTMSTFYLDGLINRYLSTINLYKQYMPGISDSQLMTLAEKDLRQHSEVQLQAYGKKTNTSTATYYTYLAYAIIAVVFLGVTSIMLVFNDEDIKRRNLGSPLNNYSMNLQILLGNLSFALIVWVTAVILGFVITGRVVYDANSFIMYANSLCFTLVCLSLSFLAGNLIRSRGAQQAIANVLALGLCFIGGVFVPQQFLGKTILFMASFTPTYWYVKAVNDIDQLLVYSAANLTPIVNSMLIQLGFAVAMLTVALAIGKQKRVSA